MYLILLDSRKAKRKARRTREERRASRKARRTREARRASMKARRTTKARRTLEARGKKVVALEQ